MMTLPNEINTATRSLHTRLNALITSRLPLALPPHSLSPDVYLTGILPFLQIFLDFEKSWELVLSESSLNKDTPRADELWVDVSLSQDGQRGANVKPSFVSEKSLCDVQSFSSHSASALIRILQVRPTGLARESRARRDIACLAGIPLEDVDDYLADHASVASSLFTRHIEHTVSVKPHVLLAYAFVMYMAVFSGGKWIRSVLSTAGTEFWTSAELPKVVYNDTNDGTSLVSSSVHEKLRSFDRDAQQNFEAAGLSFWFWSGLVDGVDTKADFKKRLDDIEDLLSADMRDDIVEEAREIFIRCEGLVSELDEQVGRQGHVLQSIITIEQQEYEADRAARAGSTPPLMPATKSGRFDWLTSSLTLSHGYTSWALLLSCVSWLVMYQAGLFAA